MQHEAECRDERAEVRDGRGSGHCMAGGTDAVRFFGTRSDIPVRRHGAVPPFDDDPVWEEIEAGRPRTVADAGGAAVLLVALATAAVVGVLLYLN